MLNLRRAKSDEKEWDVVTKAFIRKAHKVLSPMKCCTVDLRSNDVLVEHTESTDLSFSSLKIHSRKQMLSCPRRPSEMTAGPAVVRGGSEERSEPCGWCGTFGVCACERELLALFKAKDDALNMERKFLKDDELSKEDSSKSTEADSEDSLDSEPSDSDRCGLSLWQGTWNFRRVEGDFEALMVDAGVNWVIRQMAHQSNYGIGLAWQQIQQEGDKLTIIVSNGLMNTTMDLVLNGMEQTTVNEDGTAIRVTPRFENDMLLLDGRSEQTGKPLQSTRRYLCGNEMIIETTTSTGVVMKRCFRRD